MTETADTPALSLAGAFPSYNREDWLSAVEKALGGKPFDKALTSRTDDGLTLHPLYTAEDKPEGTAGLPGLAPFTRGAAAGSPSWDIRQTVCHPDPAEANREALSDLEGGATSLSLVLDLTLSGAAGVAVATLEDLDRALAGVMLDLAPVSLRAGAQSVPAAALLSALWQRRGVPSDSALGAFNADPLGVLARTGTLPQPLDTALHDMSALARETAARFPNVTAVEVDSGAYHAAGAGEAVELAAALSTGVAYLRAMEDAGLPPETAASQIVFSLAADTDIYLTVAKLRAARRLWARVLDACGVAGARPAIGAHMAERMLTARDPWGNILRATLAGFAAATGGARSITLAPYDAVCGGLPSDFARRVARNCQVILGEESRLAQVIDPAGGAWLFERLTDDLARRAWAQFQRIEGEGGMASALNRGTVQGLIAEQAEARQKAIATRKRAITGVSEFADPHEPAANPKPDTRDDAAQAARARAEQARGGDAAMRGVAFDDLVQAAADGAPMPALLRRGEAATIAPLPVRRLSEPFEALRDLADARTEATGRRPAVFMANLGPLAAHGARATWVRNALAAGGVDAVMGDGADDSETLVAQWRDSGADEAVLCGTDDAYADQGAHMARALKAAGLRHLHLAGKPGDREDTLRHAGVDAFLYMGCDLVAALSALHARMGASR